MKDAAHTVDVEDLKAAGMRFQQERDGLSTGTVGLLQLSWMRFLPLLVDHAQDTGNGLWADLAEEMGYSATLDVAAFEAGEVDATGTSVRVSPTAQDRPSGDSSPATPAGGSEALPRTGSSPAVSVPTPGGASASNVSSGELSVRSEPAVVDRLVGDEPVAVEKPVTAGAVSVDELLADEGPATRNRKARAKSTATPARARPLPKPVACLKSVVIAIPAKKKRGRSPSDASTPSCVMKKTHAASEAASENEMDAVAAKNRHAQETHNAYKMPHDTDLVFRGKDCMSFFCSSLVSLLLTSGSARSAKTGPRASIPRPRWNVVRQPLVDSAITVAGLL